jgi:lambda family phage tail tape measure protein
MTVDIATLALAIDFTQIVQAHGALDRFAAAGARAEAATAGLNRHVDAMLGPLRNLQAVMGTVTGAMAGIGGALALREIADAADRWQTLEGRLRLVTQSARELRSTQDELFAASQRTRADFSGTVDLYARLARSTRDLGISQGTLLDVTETVNKAMAVSGATAQEAAAAITQLGQGLASGQLRGDELRSVLEQAPRLAEAIAVGMGKTIGQLRTLGAEGKITSQAVIDALIAQRAVIDREFSQLPVTLSQAWRTVENSTLRYIGTTDSALGTTRALAAGVQSLGENFDTVADSAIALAGAVGTVLVARGLGPAVERAGALAVAQVQLSTATMRGTAVMLGSAQAAAAQALATKEAAASALAGAQAQHLSNQTLVAGIQAEIALANAQLGAQITARGRALMVNELAAKSRDLAAAQALLTSSGASLAAAEARATAATAAHAAALRQTTLAATLASGAMKGLQSVMAFFGGPVGFAITAAAAAVYILATRQTEAERAADQHAKAMREFNAVLDATTGKVRGVADEMRELRRLQLQESVDASKRAVSQEESYLRAGQFRINRFAFDTGLPKAEVEALVAPVRDLHRQFLAGRLEASAMLEEIAKLGNADKRLQPLAAEFANLGATLLDMIAKLAEAEAALAVLNGTATDAQRALLGIGQAAAAGGRATQQALSEFQKALAQLELVRDTIGKSEADSLRLKLSRQRKDDTGEMVFTSQDVERLVAVQRQIDALKIGEKTRELQLEERQLYATAEQAAVLNGLRQAGIHLAGDEIGATGEVVRGLNGHERALAGVILSLHQATDLQRQFREELEADARARKEAQALLERYDPSAAIRAARDRMKELQAAAPDMVTDKMVDADLAKVRDGFMGYGPRLADVRAAEAAQRQMETLRALQQEGGASAKAMAAAWDDAYDAMLSASDNWQDGAILAFREYEREATNAARQTYRFTRDVFQSMEDSIIKAVRTGKLEFTDLFNTIIEGLIRIQAQKMIIGPLSGLFDAFTAGVSKNLFGGFGSPSTDTLQADYASFYQSTYQPGAITVESLAPLNHFGGMAGMGGMYRPVDPSIFIGAPRFHTGKAPHLYPGEVAAILKDDEEVLTRDDPRHRWNQRPAGGGGGMQVIINDQRTSSGAEPVQVQRRTGPDGIDALEVFIRDAVDTSIRRGHLDGAMSSTFGARRQGTRRS